MVKTIYLAGGCFWGVEHYLKHIPGVVKTEVGYANGNCQHPTYEQVCSGHTKHAETVKVEYEDTRIRLEFLLSVFYLIIDPISVNQQGNDQGIQYRTGIYYTDLADLSKIEVSLKQLQLNYAKPLMVEVMALNNYAPAEKMHQAYLANQPQGYCHINPSMFNLAKTLLDPAIHFPKPDHHTLKTQLSSLAYEVTQRGLTEPPFKNQYDQEFATGIYVDITTGAPLFLSTHKFDAGCGWPAFSRPINPLVLSQQVDHSHGMSRTEVKTKHSQAHLGHVFNDGPKDQGGLRYCINSASLRFIPAEQMQAAGYGKYLVLLNQK